MRTVINEKNVMRIAVWREIAVEKARRSGVVKGTARRSAPRVTTGAITIGVVVPIADATAINHRRCFPVIPTVEAIPQQRSLMTSPSHRSCFSTT